MMIKVVHLGFFNLFTNPAVQDIFDSIEDFFCSPLLVMPEHR